MGAVAFRLTKGGITLGSGSRRHVVLRDVDLQVASGELLAVVGPSGSGKSTLLSALAGLIELDSGSLESGTGTGIRPGIVFQDPHLLPWLNVADNVALGLRYRAHGSRPGRRARAERREIARRALADFGIGNLADRFPAELSGGQAQRVAIARTIVVEPNVLLLDEPFGALDPRTRRDLQDWLLDLRTRLGLTAVLVTHDVDEALYLGDRIAVLSATTRCLDVIDGVGHNRMHPAALPARDQVLARLGVTPVPVPA